MALALALAAVLFLGTPAAAEPFIRHRKPVLMATAWTVTADDGMEVRNGVLIGLGRVPPLFVSSGDDTRVKEVNELCRSEWQTSLAAG